MKVRINKCSIPGSWYKDLSGRIVDVSSDYYYKNESLEDFELISNQTINGVAMRCGDKLFNQLSNRNRIFRKVVRCDEISYHDGLNIEFFICANDASLLREENLKELGI